MEKKNDAIYDLVYERWLLKETEKGSNASDWMSMKLGAAILRMLIRQHDEVFRRPASRKKNGGRDAKR